MEKLDKLNGSDVSLKTSEKMMAQAISISDIELYEALKDKLGEKEARSLVEYVETRVERKFEEKKDVLASKLDIADVELKIEAVKSEIIKWMFIFWIGQLASLVAILQLFFK